MGLGHSMPLAFGLALVAAAVIACGGGGDGAGPAREAEGVKLSDMELAALPSIGPVSDRVRAILADQILTTAEYELAWLEREECLLESGFSNQRPGARGGWWRSSSGEASEQLWRQCNADILVLSWIWSAHHRPTELELRAARETLARCLEDLSGATLPEHPSTEDFEAYSQSAFAREHPSAFSECQYRVEEEHGLLDFGG
jgi:hypothetical protein